MATEHNPAFRLYLLRHAKAAWAAPGETDFDRRLDDTGFAEAELMAEEAAERGFRPDLVISSTAERCRQTAEPLRRAFGEELAIVHVDTLYTGTVGTYAEIAFAARPQTSVMIVGHNPMIEDFLHELVGAEAAKAAPFGYPTAGLAVIDFDARPTPDAPGTPRLADFLAPRPAA